MNQTLTKDPKLLAKLEATRIRHGLPPTVYEQELIQLMILDQMADAEATEVKKHPHMEKIKKITIRVGRMPTPEERKRTSERYKIVRPWLYSKPSDKSRQVASLTIQKVNAEGKAHQIVTTPETVRKSAKTRSRKTRSTVIELHHKVWNVQFIGTVDEFLSRYPDINIMQITKMIKDPQKYQSYKNWKLIRVISRPPN